MENLEFKTTDDWSLQGSNKKELYISLVAKIDDWKKNVIFYRSRIEKEAIKDQLGKIIFTEKEENYY